MDRKIVDELTKKLVDEGKIIEAGWMIFRLCSTAIVSEETASLCRDIYFLGAHHLYSSIMSMLEDGVNETPNDLKRMELIDTELRYFVQKYKEDNFN